MKTTTKIAMFLTAGTLALPMTATAADRTVCFELKINHNNLRWDCPDASTPGGRRACRNSSGYGWAVGFVYNVYDKDSGNGENDDFIGRWHVAGTGERCITFPWEGESYAEGEANPDVYIEINNRVTAKVSDHSRTIDIIDNNEVDWPKTWWRNGVTGDSDRYVARNCQAGTTCRILPGNFMVPTDDPATDYGKALIIADSAQRMIQIFYGSMNASNVDIKYPAPECSTGCAVSQTLAKMPRVRFDEGVRVAHELGHVLQMQQFEQNSLPSNNCWRGEIGQASSNWWMGSVEYYGCATTEGWASYVAGASWWNPEDTGSIPVYHGVDFEDATLLGADCAQSSRVPGQVAKAFWDLDDANNEAGTRPTADDDVTNVDTLWIVEGWDVFDDGPANRQDQEADRNAGINAYDYDFNRNVNDQTFFKHNCLGSQTN